MSDDGVLRISADLARLREAVEQMTLAVQTLAVIQCASANIAPGPWMDWRSAARMAAQAAQALEEAAGGQP